MRALPDEVILRYAFKHGIAASESFELFEELITFLDMAAFRPTAPSERIDGAWHEFILHTKLYADYCLERYGHFVHHVPTSPLAKENYEDNQKSMAPCSTCNSACSSGGSDPFTAKCESGPCASDCRSCKSEVNDSFQADLNV